MSRFSSNERPGFGLWAAASGALIGIQLAAGLLEPSAWTFVHPLLLFWVVLIAASGCTIAAGLSLAVAIRDDLPELGLMSSFAFAVSLLPLVHGITTPGILYESNQATMSSVLWAVPIGAVAILPLALPRSRLSQRIMRNWDLIAGTHIGCIAAIAVILLVNPSALPAPAMRSWSSAAIALFALAICLAVSIRHLRLAWIAKTGGPLAVAIGFSSLGAANLVWFAAGPFTASFWLAHALDIIGVFAITLVAARAYRQRRPLRRVLGPIIAQTPAAALELGLDPLVHRFVAALEQKDQITRDHVVRTAALAISVGSKLGLPHHKLHELGVGALLHDIGKLTIPHEILNKPGRLDDGEFAVMRTHVLTGESLIASSPVLACAGPIVRGHHERVDGNGYPDGLSGEQISVLARIVSVCDAYDAMANTRQYRNGMGHDKAVAILREHSGSQWDPEVVGALISIQESARAGGSALSQVGRDAVPMRASELPHREYASSVEPDYWCGCGDALPTPLLSGVGAG